MNKNTINGLLNPVRMRIVMMFLDNSLHTIGDIKDSVKDIPSASLYRHINRLLDDDIITVVSEKKKRGAIERTYQLKNNPLEQLNRFATKGSKDDMREVFYMFAMTLVMNFNSYVEASDVDFVRDSVGYRSYPLYLSDNENESFLGEFKSLLNKYVKNTPNEERKLRQFSFVYTPGGDQ